MAVQTFTSGQVLTASDTNTYLANSGLVYVKSQTVGTTVSSVTVSSAFSSTYDNYYVMWVGGVASVTSNPKMTLGASATGYYGGLILNRPNAPTPTGAADNNATSFSILAAGTVNGVTVQAELFGPFLTYRTGVHSKLIEYLGAGSAFGTYTGYHDSAASYTDFTLTANTGTFTGGTITVYGYRKA